MFVQIAEGLGIRSILHTDHKSTRAQLASFGLLDGEEVNTMEQLTYASDDQMAVRRACKFALFEAGDALRRISGRRD